MPKNTLPDWELVLSAAARLQLILPHAVLVGGTAAAIHAQHRFRVMQTMFYLNLRQHFDEVLAELESVAGWRTARIQRPIQILGSLDGIETGIRQLIRDEPLETTVLDYNGGKLTVPTKGEILRIKGVLILKRNATRDYLDFVALSDQMGNDQVVESLQRFDQIYPQPNGESALQQLQIQLANPLPFDLEETRLSEYKNLDPKWHDWKKVKALCAHCSTVIFDRICDMEQMPAAKPVA